MKHPAKWTAPVPFWNGDAPEDDDMPRPRILRFATDSFMEELFGLLERDPRGLPALEAEPETWRGPSRRSEALLAVDASTGSGPFRKLHRRLLARSPAPRIDKPDTGALKLYQPAHQRHYLVSGVLACTARPGFPDRTVDKSRNQSVSLLVRRLVPPSSDAGTKDAPEFDGLGFAKDGWTEAAFVPGASPRWIGILPGKEDLPVDGEERLPLFQAHYHEIDGCGRRLYLGTVPVGRRETYQNAAFGARKPASTKTSLDRKEELAALLDKLVLGPWKALSESCFDANGKDPVRDVMKPPKDGDGNVDLELSQGVDQIKPDRLWRFRSKLQFASWSILAELREFLLRYGKPAVQAALREDASGDGGIASLRALAWQASARVEEGFGMNLAQALIASSKTTNVERLRKIDRDTLAECIFPAIPDKNQELAKALPDFRFLLADPRHGCFPGCSGGPYTARSETPTTLDIELESLRDRILDLLDPDNSAALPDPVDVPVQSGDAWYVVRLALDHPECTHHGPLLSAPTTPFRMASYFDPDAPVRPVRIGLPVDPTPEGLRKADRNTVFMLSETMCSQIQRMKGIGFVDLVLSVLPWPFHKDLPNPPKGSCAKGNELGMMLVVSIPIITLCALIILIIMVTLLDMVFKWLPFFMFWIPVKSRKGDATA